MPVISIEFYNFGIQNVIRPSYPHYSICFNHQLKLTVLSLVFGSYRNITESSVYFPEKILTDAGIENHAFLAA